MDALEAIETRPSVGKVKPERPHRELIERLLDAATRAPNHHLTQPWRFFVVAGAARAQLGETMARSLKERLPQPEGPNVQAQLDREAAKPLRAPIVIVAAAEPSPEPRVVEIEEVEAVAAAVENLLIAAHALGLGAQWRTGDAAYDPEVKRFFGLTPRAHIAGFIYVGYPEGTGHPTARKPVADVTRWLGWEST